MRIARWSEGQRPKQRRQQFSGSGLPGRLLLSFAHAPPRSCRGTTVTAPPVTRDLLFSPPQLTALLTPCPARARARARACPPAMRHAPSSHLPHWLPHGSFTVDHAACGRQCGQRGSVPSHLHWRMVTTIVSLVQVPSYPKVLSFSKLTHKI